MFCLEEDLCLRIVSELRALGASTSADLPAIASIVARYATDDLVLAIVSKALRAARDTVAEGMLFRDGMFCIADQANFSLDLRYTFSAHGDAMDPPGWGGRLVARAADVVIANIGPEPRGGVRYDVAGVEDFSIFDRGASLENEREWRLSPGQAMIVEGGRSVVSTTHRRNSRFLSLTLMPSWPVDWIFDRATLKPIAQSISHVDDSELITCLDAAGQLGAFQLTETVESLVDHPSHAVRWRAVTALGRLSRSRALPHLRSAARDDPHPSIRRAASSTLATVDQLGG